MNKPLREELIALLERDTALRTALLKEGSLYEGYDDDMEALHLKNAQRLDTIIKGHGWPGKSLVGKDGESAAFRIAQHAISSPKLQRSFLKHLKKAVANGEATAIQEACLTDHILFNEGRPLIYGMLFDWDESGQLYAEVDDPDQVNERRARLGLKPLDEAISDHYSEIKDEGGGPPTDIKAHKLMAAEWAKRVGWR